MRTFIVNGTEYNAKPFNFNLVCDLEDMGISLEEAGRKPMSMVRAYFGMCMGKGKEAAGKELERHIIRGGKFEEIMTVMSEEMEKSDFFRNLSKKEDAETVTDKMEKTVETEKE